MTRRLSSRQFNFYGIHVCSRFRLLPYNPARHPDFTKPPQHLGLLPSYFPAVIAPRLSLYSLLSSSAISSSPAPRFSLSMSQVSPPFTCSVSLLPTSVLSMNRSTSAIAPSPNRVFGSARSLLPLIGICCEYASAVCGGLLDVKQQAASHHTPMSLP